MTRPFQYAQLGFFAKLFAVSAASVLLASCSTPMRPEPTSRPTTVVTPAPTAPISVQPSQPAAPAPSNNAAARPSSAPRAPIADRAISVAGSCTQTEEDGFREQATILVENNEVRGVNWKIWVGKKGQCSFEGADFTQTQRRPHIEMLAKDGSGCKLLIWQTEQRVTLAHSGCAKRCTPGIYEEAWPVMFHPKTGVCAKIG